MYEYVRYTLIGLACLSTSAVQAAECSDARTQSYGDAKVANNGYARASCTGTNPAIAEMKGTYFKAYVCGNSANTVRVPVIVTTINGATQEYSMDPMGGDIILMLEQPTALELDCEMGDYQVIYRYGAKDD